MLVNADVPKGPFTTADARALGLSRRDLDAGVRESRLCRVLHGVYRRADTPDTVEMRIAAAARVLTPMAVYCDRTAAWLHGVDVFDYRELEILPPLDCVVLRGRSRIERGQCAGGERDLLPEDVMTLGAVRVTTPLRTALDLGCRLRRPEGLVALDLFARHHDVSVDVLVRSLPRYRRRRGVVRLRELVPLVDPRSESPGESRTRLVIHDAGVPAPVPQHWVMHRGEPLFRLDLAWPKHRVAVEYDGEWHESTEQQRAADRARRQWLREHGWTIIVVRRGDLDPDEASMWIEDLRGALHLL
jgi:hypothetical protein